MMMPNRLHVLNRYDPTNTTTLRNDFAKEMRKRFYKLRGIIRKAIVDEDCFGLSKASTGLTTLAEMTTPGPGAFAFTTSADKVDAFMEWLDEQNRRGILEVLHRPQLGEPVQRAWTDTYIDSAYRKGVHTARQKLIQFGYDVPGIEETGGIDVVMQAPFHADRVGLLYTRTYNDLKNITSAMDGQISRVLAQSMAEGRNPREIAQLLTRTISGPVGDLGLTDTLGRFIPAQRRAEILARTEIIRAHHVATIQEYRNWKAASVTVQAEWSTAGDGRVCEDCAQLEGREFTLNEIETMIPLHPQCRCIALPVDKTKAKEEAEETIAEEITKDPVASQMDPAVAREYLQYKKEYVKVWDDIAERYPDSWKVISGQVGKASNKPFFTDSSFYNEMKYLFKQMDPNMMDVLSGWKADTQTNVGPLILKKFASIFEKGAKLQPRYNASTGAGLINGVESLTKSRALDTGLNIVQDIFGGVPPGATIANKTGYLKLRAFNQVFMEKAGIEKVTLYRGIGGRGEGQALAEAITTQIQNVAKKELARTKFRYREAPLVGYTDSKKMSEMFGSYKHKRGFSYEREVPASDVFLHRILLDGILRGGMGEREYIVFGGDISITLDKVF